MNTTAVELASNITQLTSFPDVAFRISEMLTDVNSGATEIGALIEPDPALSAALLRIANSALYGASGQVSSVERAVALVGLSEIRDLAIGICASVAFKGIPNNLITVEDFWKHSLYCATAAQSLGRKAKVCPGESLFTAGLLHDIGHLVMFNQRPELSTEALQLSLDESDGLLPYLSEREVFGFDHQVVGAELARQWQLPESLQGCIKFHHDPISANKTSDAALILHIANSVAVLAELDSQDINDAPPLDDRVFDALGLYPDVMLETLTESHKSVDELIRIFVN